MNTKSKGSSLLLWTIAGAGFILGKRLIDEMNRYRLANKVALITGGSRGFGLILARQLAEKEVKIAICSRSEEQLENARRELEGMNADVLAIPCDLTDQTQVNKLVDAVISHYGQLDILINNAGEMTVGPQEVMTIKEYQNALDIHFWAPLYSMLACIPYFKKQKEGKIVNVTSIGGKVSVPHMLPYSASKFALVGLSEGMQYELQKENIQVMTVAPYLMRTGSPRNITVKGDHEKEYAWFKTMGSSPQVSQDPYTVAKKIIHALEYNKLQPTLSYMERLASISKELLPAPFRVIMTQFNNLLPQAGPAGFVSKKGFESESRASQNKHARTGDKAALMNNEF